jgi:hypothetical protein
VAGLPVRILDLARRQGHPALVMLCPNKGAQVIWPQPSLSLFYGCGEWAGYS